MFGACFSLKEWEREEKKKGGSLDGKTLLSLLIFIFAKPAS